MMDRKDCAAEQEPDGFLLCCNFALNFGVRACGPHATSPVRCLLPRLPACGVALRV